jgi:Immunity protein 50
MDSTLNEIEGAAELERRLASWPTFHDAEVVSITLNRLGLSYLLVHTWAGQNGNKLFKSVLVQFELEGITDLSLEDFSQQNVVGAVHIKRKDKVFRLELNALYGVGGYIEAEKMRITHTPGMPTDYPNRWQSD